MKDGKDIFFIDTNKMIVRCFDCYIKHIKNEKS